MSRVVPLIGLLFAAWYVHLARAVRWEWASFWVAVAGVIAIAALPKDLLGTFAGHAHLTSALSAQTVGALWLTVAACGGVLMISGRISLWLYLLHTRAPEQEGHSRLEEAQYIEVVKTYRGEGAANAITFDRSGPQRV
jgi:hypothetical protein